MLFSDMYHPTTTSTWLSFKGIEELFSTIQGNYMESIFQSFSHKKACVDVLSSQMLVLVLFSACSLYLPPSPDVSTAFHLVLAIAA